VHAYVRMNARRVEEITSILSYACLHIALDTCTYLACLEVEENGNLRVSCVELSTVCIVVKCCTC
jgi:hypothetical protein